MKRRMVRMFQKFVLNPLVRPLAGVVPGPVLVETTGRRTGSTRRTPVGGVVRDNTIWIVAEHGRHANYVQNIEADPRVRVRVRGRWRTGTAHILPDDNPIDRLRRHRTINGMMVRIVGTELLTVRVDLDA